MNNFANYYYDYIGATGISSINDYIDYRIGNIDFTTINSSFSNLKNETYHINSNNPNLLINTEITNDYIPEILTLQDVVNTYIYNNYDYGEIRFKTKTNTEYYVKIGKNGRLYLWITYNPLKPEILAGWYEVSDILADYFFNLAIINFTLAGYGADLAYLQTQANAINAQVLSLTDLTYIHTLQINELIALQQESLVSEYLRESIIDPLTAYNNIVSSGINSVSRLSTGTQSLIGLGGLGLFGWVASGTYGYFSQLAEERREKRERLLNIYGNIITNSNASNLDVPDVNNPPYSLRYSLCNVIHTNLSNINYDEMYYDTEKNKNLGFINSNITTTQLIPSLNTNELKFNNSLMFEYAPANNPTFFGGSQIYISANEFCIQFLNDGTLTIPANMTCDVLICGAGGRGGVGAYGGGGGGGEVIYIQNYNIFAGNYLIQCGIDSPTFVDRQSRLYNLGGDIIKANGGGDGGSFSTSISVARRYPPKAYNTLSSLTQPTFNGQPSFRRDITLTTAGITYGSGTYETYCSSRFDTTNALEADKLFNYNNSATSLQFATAQTQYSTTSPFAYTGTRYLVETGYKGDWAVIKMVAPVAITSYSLYQIRSTAGQAGSAKNFRIYASNNGTTWITLQTITGATYSSWVYTNTALSGNTTHYLYYAIVVNQLSGNGGFLWLNEWEITGTEYLVNYVNDTSGGSGGGGSGGGTNIFITNQTGAPAGTPFNATYSKLTAGGNGTNTQGGNGGSALITGAFNNNISGVFTDYGLGGVGATETSTPQNPPLNSKFGTGGDGNGGLGRKGALYFRFQLTYITKFLEYTNWHKLYNINVGDGLKVDTVNNNLLSSYWSLNNNNHLYNNNSSGRIGIGTTTPTGELDVIGLVKCNYFTAIDNNSGGVYCQVNNFSTAPTAISELSILNAGLGAKLKYHPTASTTPNLFMIENNMGDLQFKTLSTNSYLYLKNSTGNIGIGTDIPTYKLDVSGNLNASSLNLGGAITGATSIACSSISSSGALSGTSLSLGGAISGATSIACSSINCSGTITAGSFSGNASTSGSTNYWIMANNIWHNSVDNRNRFYFANNDVNSHSYYKSGSSLHIFRDRFDVDICYIDRYSFQAYFEVITSASDAVSVLEPNSQSTIPFRQTYIKFGSFTEIHRCYVEDEFYNGNYKDFVNLYLGRVVVSKGKIKRASKEAGKEWQILENKEGIDIDDAQPIIELSRKKKDKAVYGVITNRKEESQADRICVNGLGEGAIWCLNTNGNLQNGDLLQTSDHLGYSERQDDDLIHNYTIGKVVMDCEFELDSPYYLCEDLGNGIRRAFLACVYMCS